MKVVILSFCVTTLYFLAVTFPEAKAIKKVLKNCRKPKGKHGSFRTAGCIKSTCLNGKWKTEINKAICCHERIAHEPNKIISQLTAEDGCTVLTIECKKEANIAKTVVKHTSHCSKPMSAEMSDDLSCYFGEKARLMLDTSPTPTTIPPSAILIAGGHQNKGSVELFLPATGKTCYLASLPWANSFFTMDSVDNTGTIIACGGYYQRTECIRFSTTSAAGSWTSHSTTQEDRYIHNSWVSPAGLLLLGGFQSPKTSEFLSGGMNITLPGNSVKGMCLIDDTSSIILTGGRPLKGGNFKEVTQFNLQGIVENLPDMQQGRWFHGCGSYNSKGQKILVVAGGLNSLNSDKLSSTETHLVGSSIWTSGESLPRAMTYSSSLSLKHEVLLFGGYSDSSTRTHAEIMSYNGTWSQVGTLQMARYGAATSKMYSLGQLDISGCN